MKKFLSNLIIFSLVLLNFAVFPLNSVQAAGNFYLAPGSMTVTNGQTFSVGVRVNASSGVDTAQANLSYPADKLDFLGLSYGGSAFEIQAQSSGGSGNIRMGRATIGSKSGDLLVGTITFRAKVSSGSAAVSFTGGTEADKAGKVIVSAGSSATYTFTKPAPVPKPDKTAPKISGVKVTNIGLNTATVVWKTNEKATSVVEYGPAKKLGIIASSSKLITSHKVSLSNKLLFPGTQFFYRVVSKDKSGNSAVSKLTSFKTKGYTVSLSVKDDDGKPLSGKRVKLLPGLETGETDESGVVVFNDIAPGVTAVHVDINGNISASEIEIAETKDPTAVQTFEIKVVAKAGSGLQVSNVLGFLPITIILILAITVVVLAWIIRSRRLSSGPKKSSKPTKSGGHPEKSPPEPSDDDKGAEPKEEEYVPKVRIIKKAEEIEAEQPTPEAKEPKMTVVRADDD